MKNLKVFQLRNEKLYEFDQLSDKRAEQSEKLLQLLIEKNLNVIFPHFEFISSEFTIDNLRPDTVAFDKERNSFVIIEYKNVKHKGVIDQGINYRRKVIQKIDAFILLYHANKGIILNKEKDVNLDETRVIYISPEFNEHQRGAIEDEIASSIEMYEITRYDNGVIMLERLGKEVNTSEKKSKKFSLRLGNYSEDDYLSGKYFISTKPNEKAKTLYFKLKNKILTEFPNVEHKQTKKYVGFYSKLDGRTICSIAVAREKLKLCYSAPKDLLPKSDFIRYMYKNGKKIGHWGLGDYQSEIKDESDVDKAIPIIQNVYDLKIK